MLPTRRRCPRTAILLLGCLLTVSAAAGIASPRATAQQDTDAGRDNPTAPFVCRTFENGEVGYARWNGAWWIGSGEHALLAVGNSSEEAEAAAMRLNDMGINHLCAVETADSGRKLQLWMIDADLPDVVARNDICQPIRHDELTVQERAGAWIVNGLPAANRFESEAVAQSVADAIRRTAARVQCHITEQSRFHYFVR